MDSWRGVGFLTEVFNTVRLMNKIGIKPLGVASRFVSQLWNEKMIAFINEGF